jgi:hypothetical protein
MARKRLRWTAHLLRAAPRPGPFLASIINTANLHDIDPQHYLTDVLERIVSGRTRTLLPSTWKDERNGSSAKRAA